MTAKEFLAEIEVLARVAPDAEIVTFDKKGNWKPVRIHPGLLTSKEKDFAVLTVEED
jgi:hypothetical protein